MYLDRWRCRPILPNISVFPSRPKMWNRNCEDRMSKSATGDFMIWMGAIPDRPIHTLWWRLFRETWRRPFNKTASSSSLNTYQQQQQLWMVLRLPPAVQMLAFKRVNRLTINKPGRILLTVRLVVYLLDGKASGPPGTFFVNKNLYLVYKGNVSNQISEGWLRKPESVSGLQR